MCLVTPVSLPLPVAVCSGCCNTFIRSDNGHRHVGRNGITLEVAKRRSAALCDPAFLGSYLRKLLASANKKCSMFIGPDQEGAPAAARRLPSPPERCPPHRPTPPVRPNASAARTNYNSKFRKSSGIFLRSCLASTGSPRHKGIALLCQHIIRPLVVSRLELWHQSRQL